MGLHLMSMRLIGMHLVGVDLVRVSHRQYLIGVYGHVFTTYEREGPQSLKITFAYALPKDEALSPNQPSLTTYIMEHGKGDQPSKGLRNH
jgi:hypothetical protein